MRGLKNEFINLPLRGTLRLFWTNCGFHSMKYHYSPLWDASQLLVISQHFLPGFPDKSTRLYSCIPRGILVRVNCLPQEYNIFTVTKGRAWILTLPHLPHQNKIIFTWELTEVCQTSWLCDQSLDTSMLVWLQKFQKICGVSVNVFSPAQQGFDVMLKVWCEMPQQPQLIATLMGCCQHGYGPFSWIVSFCLVLLSDWHFSLFPKRQQTQKY